MEHQPSQHRGPAVPGRATDGAPAFAAPWDGSSCSPPLPQQLKMSRSGSPGTEPMPSGVPGWFCSSRCHGERRGMFSPSGMVPTCRPALPELPTGMSHRAPGPAAPTGTASGSATPLTCSQRVPKGHRRLLNATVALSCAHPREQGLQNSL